MQIPIKRKAGVRFSPSKVIVQHSERSNIMPDIEDKVETSGRCIASEQMMCELRAFAVDVARNWREATQESLSAMVEVAKLDTQVDKLGDLVAKLAELGA